MYMELIFFFNFDLNNFFKSMIKYLLVMIMIMAMMNFLSKKLFLIMNNIYVFMFNYMLLFKNINLFFKLKKCMKMLIKYLYYLVCFYVLKLNFKFLSFIFYLLFMKLMFYKHMFIYFNIFFFFNLSYFMFMFFILFYMCLVYWFFTYFINTFSYSFLIFLNKVPKNLNKHIMYKYYSWYHYIWWFMYWYKFFFLSMLIWWVNLCKYYNVNQLNDFLLYKELLFILFYSYFILYLSKLRMFYMILIFHMKWVFYYYFQLLLLFFSFSIAFYMHVWIHVVIWQTKKMYMYMKNELKQLLQFSSFFGIITLYELNFIEFLIFSLSRYRKLIYFLYVMNNLIYFNVGFYKVFKFFFFCKYTISFLSFKRVLNLSYYISTYLLVYLQHKTIINMFLNSFKMNYWLNKLDLNLSMPKLNNFLLFNLLTNYSKFSFWQFFFFGFYFDEMFSKILKFLYLKILSLTSYFIMDSFFSNWSGMKLFQSFFSMFSNFFFFENLNFFFFFFFL